MKGYYARQARIGVEVKTEEAGRKGKELFSTVWSKPS